MTLPTTASYGQTLLSARLAPPRPTLRGPTSGQVNLWTFGAVLAALAVGFGVGTESAIGMWVALLVGAVAVVALRRRWTRAMKESQARFNVDVVYAGQAMLIWDRLFYCHLDDLVFLPGEPIWGPAAELSAFLAGAAASNLPEGVRLVR